MIPALNLLNEIADRKGWPQISTLDDTNPRPEHRKMIRMLNRILQTLGGYDDWPLLREEGTIVTVASEVTDADNSEYVTATQNSDTVTVDNATFDDTYINRAFQVSGNETVYRVIAVPAPTQLQLNRAWISDSITAADELTATIAVDQYALAADFQREVDDINGFFGRYKIEYLPPNEFKKKQRERANNKIEVGEPLFCTIFGVTNSRQILHFTPFPEYARLFYYDYQKSHPEINSDQDTVYYPLTYFDAFIDLMVYLMSRDYDDDARTETIIRDWLRTHSAQQSNAGPTDSRPVMQLANEVRRSLRASANLPTSIDWVDAFDNGSIFGL
jgi:hypothetical protein